jgi:DNA-binding transcriptional MerR regulator
MSTQTTAARSYTIREASRLSGLPESTLRYYETIGIINPIERDTSSKHRSYSEEDLNIIDAIACMNATGMSLQDMREYLQNRNLGAQAADEQVRLLTSQQQRLRGEAGFLKVRQEYVGLKIEYWKAVKRGDDTKARSIAENARKLADILKHRDK